jgi:predicted DNA-binding transcriptional regulator AlpA
MNEDTKNEQTEIWTPQECASFLKMSTVSLYSLTRNRGLVRHIPIPHFKLHSKALRFRKSDIISWINQIAAQQGRTA